MIFITRPEGYTLDSVGDAGSANRVIYRFVPSMWPPEPPYSGGGFSINGPDATKFRVDPNTGVLSIGPTDVPAGSYNINVLINGTNSTAVPINLRAGGQPWLSVDNWNPVAGGTVTVTVTDAPNPPPGDVLAMDWDHAWRNAIWPVANVPSDSWGAQFFCHFPRAGSGG